MGNSTSNVPQATTTATAPPSTHACIPVSTQDVDMGVAGGPAPHDVTMKNADDPAFQASFGYVPPLSGKQCEDEYGLFLPANERGKNTRNRACRINVVLNDESKFADIAEHMLAGWVSRSPVREPFDAAASANDDDGVSPFDGGNNSAEGGADFIVRATPAGELTLMSLPAYVIMDVLDPRRPGKYAVFTVSYGSLFTVPGLALCVVDRAMGTAWLVGAEPTSVRVRGVADFSSSAIEQLLTMRFDAAKSEWDDQYREEKRDPAPPVAFVPQASWFTHLRLNNEYKDFPRGRAGVCALALAGFVMRPGGGTMSPQDAVSVLNESDLPQLANLTGQIYSRATAAVYSLTGKWAEKATNKYADDAEYEDEDGKVTRARDRGRSRSRSRTVFC